MVRRYTLLVVAALSLFAAGVLTGRSPRFDSGSGEAPSGDANPVVSVRVSRPTADDSDAIAKGQDRVSCDLRVVRRRLLPAGGQLALDKNDQSFDNSQAWALTLISKDGTRSVLTVVP